MTYHDDDGHLDMPQLKASLETVERLSKKAAETSKGFTREEVRLLVSNYYLVQDQRMRMDNQVRSLDEPPEIVGWLSDQFRLLESNIRRVLNIYTDNKDMGRWSKSIIGIGPVISAGLMAHIDITRAQTAGAIWRYAGLDPTCVWEKGQKRPWNAALKRLCWLLGESFVKTCNHDRSTYGPYYINRKAMEIARDTEGYNQAVALERAKQVGKTTEAYKHYSQGHLPPGHIHARAKRYAVKLFLAHWHDMAYRMHFRRPPPLPYPIAHLNHVHYIAPPGAEEYTQVAGPDAPIRDAPIQTGGHDSLENVTPPTDRELDDIEREESIESRGPSQ